jgi:hypothetical protein
MHWTKLSGIAAGAAVLIATPAIAHADAPVPTTDEVVAVLAGLTDPDIPAANKGNIVTPGFAPEEEAGTIDNHLNRMRAHGGISPLNFVVTDIVPAPNNFAGATVATIGTPRQHAAAEPIVLVDQDGHWLITHDSAVAEMDEFWRVAERHIAVIVP